MSSTKCVHVPAPCLDVRRWLFRIAQRYRICRVILYINACLLGRNMPVLELRLSSKRYRRFFVLRASWLYRATHDWHAVENRRRHNDELEEAVAAYYIARGWNLKIYYPSVYITKR